MVVVSTRDVREHVAQVPAGWEGEAPVFQLQPPSVRVRAAFRRDLTATGSRHVTSEELYRVLREVLTEAAPENLAQLLELCDRGEAIALGRVEGDEETAREIIDLDRRARAHPSYAALHGEMQYRWERSLICAFAHVVVGWRGIEPAFRRVNGAVPYELIDQLPEDIVRDVGVAAMALFAPRGAQEKNSESPRPLPSDPATSPTESGHPTAASGGSAATSTT